MFSCEFCEIFKNTFFYRSPLVVASNTHVIPLSSSSSLWLFKWCNNQTLFYRARKKLKNGIKLNIDPTKKRFNVLFDAQSFIQGKENIKHFHANCCLFICNLKIRLKTMVKKSFLQWASWKVCFQSNNYRFLFLEVIFRKHYF